MNSAAVIGRQLRQQQTTAGRTSGPLCPPSPHKGRPRTPSHHVTSPPAADTKQQQQKPKGLAKMKSCLSCRCIWLCLKALSGGVLLIAIGVGMTVFGFYADHFAVQETTSHNATVRVVNDHLKIHLHNLTYVGPVFMGLGGMMIVAACVLLDAQRDAEANRARRHPNEDAEQLLASDKPHANGPLLLSNPFFRPIIREEEEEEVMTVAIEVEPPPLSPLPVSSPAAADLQTQPSTLSSPAPPPLPPVVVRQPPRRSSTMTFLSPLFDAPSPLDIQILDPDGCTPDTALEMDVFSRTTKCHAPPSRLHMEPRLLASIESDGFSDDDDSDTTPPRLKGRFCSPPSCEDMQDMPLLGGRCSPPSSPEYPLEPLLKRDRVTPLGLRRFQLMRQVPNRTTTLFDGPSSEGGGAR